MYLVHYSSLFSRLYMVMLGESLGSIVSALHGCRPHARTKVGQRHRGKESERGKVEMEMGWHRACVCCMHVWSES